MSKKSQTVSIGGINIGVTTGKSLFVPENYRKFISAKKPGYFIDYKPIINAGDAFYLDNVMNCEVGGKQKEWFRIERKDKKQRMIIFKNDKYATHDYWNPLVESSFVNPELFLHAMIRFLKGRGVFLHAVAGIYKGDGFLFCGPSEAGKSTIAKKWRKNADILCDERVIVAKYKRSIHVFGSPWPGELDLVSNKSAKLKYFFLLRKTGPAYKRVETPGRFVKWIMPQTYHRPWDRAFMSFLLNFLDEIYKKIPIYWINRNLIKEPRVFFDYF